MEIVNELLQTLYSACIILICTFVTLCLKRITEKTGREIKEIEQKSELDLYQNAIKEIDNLAKKTVTALEEVFGKDIREDIKNGLAKKSELEALNDIALSEIINNLKPEFKKAIEKNMQDYQTYISIIIENQVKGLK